MLVSIAAVGLACRADGSPAFALPSPPCTPLFHRQFRIRFVAMQLYYAEVAYKSKTGAYTEDLDALQPYVPQLSTLSCEVGRQPQLIPAWPRANVSASLTRPYPRFLLHTHRPTTRSPSTREAGSPHVCKTAAGTCAPSTTLVLSVSPPRKHECEIKELAGVSHTHKKYV